MRFSTPLVMNGGDCMHSLNDAQMRWNETIVKVGGVPTYIGGVADKDRTSYTLTMYQLGKDGAWHPETSKVRHEMIDETIPEMGMMQYGIAAYYVTRKASKQYRRGIVPRQLDSRLIGNTRFLSSRIPAPSFPEPRTINQLYNPEYIPVMAASRDLMRGDYFSCAVSQRVALAAGASRWPVVYYKEHAVGLLRGDTIEVVEPAACLREVLQNEVNLRVAIR